MTLSRTKPPRFADLFALADILIPASREMPSASQADPEGAWTSHVLQVRPDLPEILERALAKAAHATDFDDIDRALADDPNAFAALTLVVAGAYYLNPEIRRRVGYPGQVAQPPTANWSFGTEELIERVRARGRLYRPTPGQQKERRDLMAVESTRPKAGRKQAIQTNEAPPPGGAYSQGIRVGSMVFLSGQTPRGLDRRIVKGSFEDQARQVFDNLNAVARAANSSLADAVRVTVYLRDWANFSIMDGIYASYFPEPRPARTTIQSNIPVEIEVDAILLLRDESTS